ncbi:cadherin domain-containing protein, partial [Bathymodiolus thermophilus thioautotrophic gill symbiont]
IEDDKRKLLDGSSSGTVATLTTTDADTNNTFTYTLTNNENNTLKISNDGTKLELQATVDYEANTNKTLSFSIKVNDGNGHEFTQDFTLEIKDVDDVAPTNILINTTNIADNI